MSSITSQLIAANCVTRKMYFADSTDFVTFQFSSKIRFDGRFHFSNTKTGSELPTRLTRNYSLVNPIYLSITSSRQIWFLILTFSASVKTTKVNRIRTVADNRLRQMKNLNTCNNIYYVKGKIAFCLLYSANFGK